MVALSLFLFCLSILCPFSTLFLLMHSVLCSFPIHGYSVPFRLSLCSFSVYGHSVPFALFPFLPVLALCPFLPYPSMVTLFLFYFLPVLSIVALGVSPSFVLSLRSVLIQSSCCSDTLIPSVSHAALSYLY